MSNAAITQKNKKNSQAAYSSQHQLPMFRQLCNFFVVTLKLLRKSSIFSFLCVTQTYILTAFKKSNKFCCVQATKIIKSKDVVKDEILQTVTTHFSSFFKFYFFCDKLRKLKSEKQLAYNWFIFNVLNSFGLTDFVLALFFLC